MKARGPKSSLLLVAGVVTYALALFHAAFWTIFDWKTDLAALQFENRAITQAANVAMIYVLLVMATLSVFRRRELIETGLGRFTAASIAGFWVVRLAAQVAFFGFGAPISIVMMASFVLMAVPYVFAAASAARAAEPGPVIGEAGRA